MGAGNRGGPKNKRKSFPLEKSTRKMQAFLQRTKKKQMIKTSRDESWKHYSQ